MLDIGEGVGALVVYVPAELRGAQIEVSPKDLDAPMWHTDVLDRRIDGRTVFAGVFPQLPAGGYRIWTDQPAVQTAVTIVSGQITEIDWR